MQCARPFVHKYTNGCFLVAWAVRCSPGRRQNRPRLTWWCLGRCPPRGVAEEAAPVRPALCALRTFWAKPYLSIQTNDSKHYGFIIGSKIPQRLEPLAQQRAAGAVGGVHSLAALRHWAVGVPPVPASGFVPAATAIAARGERSPGRIGREPARLTHHRWAKVQRHLRIAQAAADRQKHQGRQRSP